MEPVTSSLISHRGYDPEARVMCIRFVHKTYKNGPLYEYGNVGQVTWDEGCSYVSERTGELSFGAWFQRFIKPYEKTHPFRKLEDASNGAEQLPLVDFASGSPVPVVETETLPEDIEELGAKALALQETARDIIINSGEAYRLAETTAVAITRMRDALERTMRPKIKELYEPYKAALAILNRYDGPLESDQKRLTAGMATFKRAEDARVAEDSRRERERLQGIEDQKARERAEELKRADIQSAIDAGETKLAKQIEKAPALPVQAKYVPPVAIASEIPQSKSSYHVEAWEYEWVDSRGTVVEHPDLSLIPQQYIIVDVKAIAAAVKRTKNRTAIPGVRAYDAGAVRLKKK